jgi:hypothetical protein
MKRLETGVVQINGDWPGVFIRGDDALHYSKQLAFVLGELRGHRAKCEEVHVMQMIADAALQGMINLLQASNMGSPDFKQNIQRIEGTVHHAE